MADIGRHGLTQLDRPLVLSGPIGKRLTQQGTEFRPGRSRNKQRKDGGRDDYNSPPNPIGVALLNSRTVSVVPASAISRASRLPW